VLRTADGARRRRRGGHRRGSHLARRQPASRLQVPGEELMAKPNSSHTGLVYASLRIFDFSLGEMLWSPRTVFMGLIVGLPVLLSFIVRPLFEAGLPAIRVGRGAAGGPLVFGLMIWVFFVRFAVPVLGVFYGTSLIADEVEDKTITYLFTRPI